MDLTNIHPDVLNTDFGLKLGSDDAPVKLVEFINYRCPFARKYFQQNMALLDDFVKTGKLQRIIKTFDRPKAGLRKGNELHQYINYADPVASYEMIKEFFSRQEEFGAVEDGQVGAWAEREMALKKQGNAEIAQKIREEGEALGISSVPAAFLDGHIFDEHEDYFTVRQWLQSACEKAVGQVIIIDPKIIDLSVINDSNAIKYGRDTAPVKVTEFINFSSTDSAKYANIMDGYLENLADQGKVQRIIKHVDIEQGGLYKGDVMNRFISYNTEQAYPQYKKIIGKQLEWLAKDWRGIFQHASEKFGFAHQGNRILSQIVKNQAEDAGIKIVPTVVVNNQVFAGDAVYDSVKCAIDKLIK